MKQINRIAKIIKLDENGLPINDENIIYNEDTLNKEIVNEVNNEKDIVLRYLIVILILMLIITILVGYIIIPKL